MTGRGVRTILGIALLLSTAYPLAAQKSNDTVRIGMAGPLANLSSYHDSGAASAFVGHGLFDTAIGYDERSGRYQPLLAKSWRRIDERTLELEIRDDVKWHDGTNLDADDVFYTYDWLGSPDTRLHLQHQWDWIDHVEKLGRYKLRLFAKQAIPYDIARLASVTPIVPEHKHGLLLAERYYFGRNPIGTGPYRLAKFDQGDVLLTHTGAYRHGGEAKPVPRIAQVRLHANWKFEDRVAEFKNGALDLLLNAEPVPADSLARARGAQITAAAGNGMLVLAYDTRAKGRPLADGRIRRALDLAIEHTELLRSLPEGVRVPMALCWPEQAGCGATPALPASDLAAARALLAQVQGPVALTLAAVGAQAAMQAEIVARQWRQLGVTVKVENVLYEEFYIRVRDRSLDAGLFPWHAGVMPDVADMMQTFFAPGIWDLHEDPALHGFAAASDGAMDDTARRRIAGQAFAHVAANNYFSPLAPLPSLALHGADLSIDARGRYDVHGFTILDLAWK